MLTDSRLHNIKQEKQLIQESLEDYQQFIEHVQSLQKVFTWKGGEENQEMENLQVRMYNQTIIQATLVDELEGLLIFMEELIKKHKGDKAAEDSYAF